MRLLTALPRAAVALALLTFAGAAHAQPPQKIFNLIVYGDDPCPKGQGDEIIVCARKPESERYRIPRKLREKPEPAGSPGWGSQVATMEQVQRSEEHTSELQSLMRNSYAVLCLQKKITNK